LTGFQTSKVIDSGYVSAKGDNSLLYPAFALNSHGDGALGFALVGLSQFPSAAYVPVKRGKLSAGPIQLAVAGTQPFDSYTG